MSVLLIQCVQFCDNVFELSLLVSALWRSNQYCLAMDPFKAFNSSKDEPAKLSKMRFEAGSVKDVFQQHNDPQLAHCQYSSGITLTGSEMAGPALPLAFTCKKTVLELGGSDA
jgi:hypothetical protein